MTSKWIGIACVAGALLGACGSRQPVTVVEPVEDTVECSSEQWVHMPMLITFASSGTELDEQNRIILNEMVRTASTRRDIVRVRVEGHTDTCGNEINNLALSEARATHVATELVSMGVPGSMIDTVGYGSAQPRGEEDCTQGQRLTQQTNRRVEFSLLVCR